MAWLPNPDDFIKAIDENDLSTVKLMVRQGVDIHSPAGPAKVTPLMSAAAHGHDEIVKFLIDSKADANITDDDGFTALLSACISNFSSPKIVSLLLDAGAKIDAVNKFGYTALAMAVRWGHEDVVAVLLERGAAIDIASNSGETASSLAMKYEQPHIAAMLKNAAEDRIRKAEAAAAKSAADKAEKALHEQAMQTQKHLKELAQKYKFKPR
jgi:ankyrin repeat protein